MTFEELTERAVQVRKRYDKLNAARGVTWNEQNWMSGFVGDVGDLSKSLTKSHRQPPSTLVNFPS